MSINQDRPIYYYTYCWHATCPVYYSYSYDIILILPILLSVCKLFLRCHCFLPTLPIIRQILIISLGRLEGRIPNELTSTTSHPLVMSCTPNISPTQTTPTSLTRNSSSDHVCLARSPPPPLSHSFSRLTNIMNTHSLLFNFYRTRS